MNIFRLQLMADLLKEMTVEIPVYEFVTSQSAWGEADKEVTCLIEGFSLDDWTNVDGERPHCGYSACAVGHAMLDVRFNALGLYHVDGVPGYNGMTNWEAVREFFGITEETAEILFAPGTYDTEYDPLEDEDVSTATPENVLERVMYLLKHGETDLETKYS